MLHSLVSTLFLHRYLQHCKADTINYSYFQNNRKEKRILRDCPNSSVTVIAPVCGSVPNLSIVTTRGNEHSSFGPPSNEHVTVTSLLFDSHLTVWRPASASATHEIESPATKWT